MVHRARNIARSSTRPVRGDAVAAGEATVEHLARTALTVPLTPLQITTQLVRGAMRSAIKSSA